MAIFNAVAIVLALATFLGIVWWAFSAGRAQANQEAALLPFAVPDERLLKEKSGEPHE